MWVNNIRPQIKLRVQTARKHVMTHKSPPKHILPLFQNNANLASEELNSFKFDQIYIKKLSTFVLQHDFSN